MWGITKDWGSDFLLLLGLVWLFTAAFWCCIPFYLLLWSKLLITASPIVYCWVEYYLALHFSVFLPLWDKKYLSTAEKNSSKQPYLCFPASLILPSSYSINNPNYQISQLCARIKFPNDSDDISNSFVCCFLVNTMQSFCQQALGRILHYN